MPSSPAVLAIEATETIGPAHINELVPDHRAGRLRLVAVTRKERCGAVTAGARERSAPP